MRLSVLVLAALVVIVAVSGCAVFEKQTFMLVEGESKAVIIGNDVIPKLKELGYYSGPQRALHHYIRRSTGRILDKVSEKDYDPVKHPYAIFVGRTKLGLDLFGDVLKTMDADSYIVHIGPTFAVLIGASKHSTAWAQFDFLREYLGVDAYFPGKCGLVIPRNVTVRIPVETRFEVPVFRSRAFSALNTHRQLRGNADIPWRIYRRFDFHHNIQNFIKVKEFGKTHPEYFPWRNGKRIIVSTSAGPGPCISNPDVVRIITKKCREYFDKNPKKITISLGMTDGGWCDCPKCNAMDGKDIFGEVSKSVRYYTFLNQVARGLRKTHPGKYIGVLGYAGAEAPPAGMKVEKNIMPYLCYTRGNWAHPEVRKRDLDYTNAWLKRLECIGIYEYLYGMGFSVPRLYLHDLAEFLRHVGKEAPGSGFYTEIYSNHGLDGPKAWVVEKLVWNPNQDVDKLIRRWCEACFEDAADPMEDYFRGLAKTWRRNNRKQGPIHGKFQFMYNDRQLELFTPEDLKPRWNDLRRAEKLANSNAVRGRIFYFASTLKIADLTVRQYHAYKTAQNLGKAKAPAASILAALIEGDRSAPKDNLVAYIEKVKRQDKSKFMGGVQIKAATELARRIVNELAWPVVYKELKAGATKRETLILSAREAIAAAVPKGKGNDPVARARVNGLMKMASRIAMVPRAEKPPAIDGKLDEEVWKWNSHHPWFAWKSGVQVPYRTHFALAYDDDYLYLAVRCPQDDLKKRRRAKGYGTPAWKYASIEFFISPDGKEANLAPAFRDRNAPPEQIRTFQVIAAYGGGLWERGQHAVEQNYVTTDDGKTEWRTEMKISWKKLRFSPKQHRFMRIQLVRNTREGGHSGVAWYPSTGAHAAHEARGWAVFE